MVQDVPEIRAHLPVPEDGNEPGIAILAGKKVTILNLVVLETAVPPLPDHPLECAEFRLITPSTPRRVERATVELDADLVRLPTGIVDILLQCGDTSLQVRDLLCRVWRVSGHGLKIQGYNS